MAGPIPTLAVEADATTTIETVGTTIVGMIIAGTTTAETTIAGTIGMRGGREIGMSGGRENGMRDDRVGIGTSEADLGIDIAGEKSRWKFCFHR